MSAEREHGSATAILHFTRDEYRARVDRSVRALAELGAQDFFEVGPGAALSGMIKRILVGVRPKAVCEPASFEKLG